MFISIISECDNEFYLLCSPYQESKLFHKLKIFCQYVLMLNDYVTVVPKRPTLTLPVDRSRSTTGHRLYKLCIYDTQCQALQDHIAFGSGLKYFQRMVPYLGMVTILVM